MIPCRSPLIKAVFPLYVLEYVMFSKSFYSHLSAAISEQNTDDIFTAILDEIFRKNKDILIEHEGCKALSFDKISNEVVMMCISDQERQATYDVVFNACLEFIKSGMAGMYLDQKTYPLKYEVY